jgi:hypothetical protein
MIYFFSGARKVRRHIVSVDNLRELFIDFFPDRLVRITNSPVFSSPKNHTPHFADNLVSTLPRNAKRLGSVIRGHWMTIVDFDRLPHG